MDVRTAPFHARSCTAPARSHAVVVEHRSDRRGSVHVVAAGSRPSAGRDVVGRSGLRVDLRSSRAVVECDGGSRRGVGCSHVAGRGDRSSRLLLVVGHHSRDRREGLASANGIAHADAGLRIEACGC